MILQSLIFNPHANVFPGGKFEPVLNDNAYKVVMRLNIKSVSTSDFGSYRCVAKNSLGDTDGTIKLYKIPRGEMNHIEHQEGKRRGELISRRRRQRSKES